MSPNESSCGSMRLMQIFKEITENECMTTVRDMMCFSMRLMQIFKEITENECMTTVRDMMCFSIIHFHIAYRLLIGVKISDLE